MKARWWITGCTAALLAISGGVASAHSTPTNQPNQENKDRGDHKFSDHDKQSARDWAGKHKDNMPAGFREEDKLSPNSKRVSKSVRFWTPIFVDEFVPSRPTYSLLSLRRPAAIVT